MYPLLKNARWTWTVISCGLPSLWYWADPITHQPEPSLWLAHAVIFSVFAALLYFGYRRADRYPGSFISAMTLLALAATPFNGNAVLFMIYAAGFTGAFRQVRTGVVVTVVLLGVLAGQARFLGAGMAYWTAMALFMVSVSSYSLFSAIKRRHDSVLRLKQSELEHLAQVAERERIARDLHDSVGHSLSLIAVKLHLAEKLMVDRPKDAVNEIKQLREVVRASLREVRDLVHGYAQQGIENAIKSGKLGLQAAGIETEFELKPVSLTTVASQSLGLVVREALTNVIRHSKASRCKLSLRQTGDQVVLLIEDDGVGAVDPMGFGTRSIHERIDALGGKVAITADRGIRLEVRIASATMENNTQSLVPALTR